MQIPCTEFLILYFKGRNQECVFLIRASTWLCLRNLEVEITCPKQLLTVVRKLRGVGRFRPFLAYKVSRGKPEVISVLGSFGFFFLKPISAVVCHSHCFTFSASMCRVVMRKGGIANRLSSWILVLAHIWIKIRGDRSIQETAVSQHLPVGNTSGFRALYSPKWKV